MYSLLKAIRTVEQMDTSPNRVKAFEEIASNHAIINLAYRAFSWSANTPIGGMLLLLYGLKCYMTIKQPTQEQIELLCFASYPNEFTAINYLKAHLLETNVVDLYISRKYIFAPYNWLDSFWYFLLIPRFYRFARQCSISLHFMPACRVFSTISFYLRYKHILKRVKTKGVLIANHYSPECTALAAAAHSKSIKVLFTNHAHAAIKMPFLPSPAVDLALLTSEAAYLKYRGSSKESFNYTLIGYVQEKNELKLDFSSNKNLTVGIFLTALTNKNHIQELVVKIQRVLPSVRILLRPHPVAILNDNFSDIVKGSMSVELSKKMSLNSDLCRCDLAVCGNTSAVIEILKGGCPVLYDANLDRIAYDYNGFVGGGLIFSAEKIDEQILTNVADFYRRAEWETVMQFFDASYLKNRDKLLKKAEKEIKRVLNE